MAPTCQLDDAPPREDALFARTPGRPRDHETSNLADLLLWLIQNLDAWEWAPQGVRKGAKPPSDAECRDLGVKHRTAGGQLQASLGRTYVGR